MITQTRNEGKEKQEEEEVEGGGAFLMTQAI